MMKWIGAAALGMALMIVGAGRIESVLAAPLQAAAQASQASRPTDVSARRRYHRHDRYSDRRYDRPYGPYYARPTSYAPYPYYASFPFGFGFGVGPW